MQQANDILTPYYRLDPETLIRVIESTGLLCDGRLLALNSYENRVYQVGIEDAQPLVTKVYRPGRWTDEQILEEHAFSLEIADAEIPNGTGGQIWPPERMHRFRRAGIPDQLLWVDGAEQPDLAGCVHSQPAGCSSLGPASLPLAARSPPGPLQAVLTLPCYRLSWLGWLDYLL